MRILISGANGYIGTRLTDFLISNGANVSLLVRDKNKLDIKYNDLNTYSWDITSPQKISFKEKVDVFIHLAAANDIDSKDSRKALEGTVLGTKNCLDLAVANGIKKFVYFSTFQIYGKSDGVINELTSVEPVNDYAITHLFAEEYVKMYSRICDVNYLIIRPANIYGAPRSLEQDRWSLAPSCFCVEAFKSGKITLKTSGKQFKDFIGLDQLVAWTYQLLVSFDKNKNQIVNFSSAESITVKELAEKVAIVYQKKFLKECRIETLSDFPLKSEKLFVDNQKLKALTEHILIDNLDVEIERIFSILEKGENIGPN